MKSDKKIIAAVLMGDTNLYAVLINRHSDKIYALALSLLKNKEDAEEIAQNVFLKAFQALQNFKGKAKFSSFLYRICYNESMNRIKQRKKTFDIEEVEISDQKINDDFFNIQHNEQKKFLKIALNRLNPDFRMMLTLFYFEEQSYNEIVELTGMPE